MDHRSEILCAMKHYCELTGLAPATVATKIMNDGKFFDRIQNGGNFTMITYERVKDWFKENTDKVKSKKSRDN